MHKIIKRPFKSEQNQQINDTKNADIKKRVVIFDQKGGENNFGINHCAAKTNRNQITTKHTRQFIGSEDDAQVEFMHKKCPNHNYLYRYQNIFPQAKLPQMKKNIANLKND
jgi:hypothetical protein